jgi:hypothetical protein
MIVCLKCGHQNPDGETFCQNKDCGAFLEWHHGDVAPTQELPPSQPPKVRPATATPAEGKQRRGVRATLSDQPLEAELDGEGSTELRVRNTGTIVDEFVIEVRGAAAGWAGVEPPTLSLFPGAEDAVRVVFRPLRAPDTPAGAVPFEIKVVSRVDPNVAAFQAGVVMVGHFSVLSAELTPPIASGWRATTHRLRLSNQGNTPVEATVGAVDPEEALSFSVSPSILRPEPGTSATAVVRTRTRGWVWWGTPVRRPFKLLVQPRVEPPLTAEGTMMQTPLLPRWSPKAAIVAVGAIVAIAGARAFGLGRGEKPANDLAAGQQTETAVLDAAVNAPTAPPAPTDQPAPPPPAPAAVPPAVPPAPAPPAPAPASAPTTPAPAPSATPPPAPPPVTVPDLAGKTAADAEAALTAAGLTPAAQRVNVVSDTVGHGLVLRTDPAAAAAVAKGSPVTLHLSRGPAVMSLDRVAEHAHWFNGTLDLSFPGPETATAGTARRVENQQAEDRSIPPRALAIHPAEDAGAFVQGDFTLPAPIEAGDVFAASVGFLQAATGTVRFEVYALGGPFGVNAQPVGAVDDAADGQLRPVELDLTRVAGAQILRLRVVGPATPVVGSVIWVDPRVESPPAPR